MRVRNPKIQNTKRLNRQTIREDLFKKSIKEIVAMAPIFTALAIMLGFIRIAVYYGLFGIAIINYLEFSEILTSFLDHLAISLILVLYLAFGMFNLKNLPEFAPSVHASIEKVPWHSIFVYGSIFSQISIFIAYLFKWLPKYWALFLICMILGVTLLRFAHKYFNSIEKSTILIFTLFSLLCFSGASALLKANKVSDTKSTKRTQIHLDDGRVLTSTDSSYYIGKTRNYIFLYHENSKLCEVIPIDKVNRLIFPHNK